MCVQSTCIVGDEPEVSRHLVVMSTCSSAQSKTHSLTLLWLILTEPHLFKHQVTEPEPEAEPETEAEAPAEEEETAEEEEAPPAKAQKSSARATPRGGKKPAAAAKKPAAAASKKPVAKKSVAAKPAAKATKATASKPRATRCVCVISQIAAFTLCAAAQHASGTMSSEQVQLRRLTAPVHLPGQGLTHRIDFQRPALM